MTKNKDKSCHILQIRDKMCDFISDWLSTMYLHLVSATTKSVFALQPTLVQASTCSNNNNYNNIDDNNDSSGD